MAAGREVPVRVVVETSTAVRVRGFEHIERIEVRYAEPRERVAQRILDVVVERLDVLDDRERIDFVVIGDRYDE